MSKILTQLSWGAYIAVCILSPAMTIDVVLNFGTDWAIYLNIGILCLVCVIYTLLGGMKAVIWTDVIQGVVMVLTIFFIFGKMVSDLGLELIFERCGASKCNTMWPTWLNTSDYFDLRYRTPPTTFIFRTFIDITLTIPLQQSMVQRFQMCGSMNKVLVITDYVYNTLQCFLAYLEF